MRIGINPTSIGVSARWWLEAVRLAGSAGLDAAWAWDHFISRGRVRDPVLECWSLLAAAAATTERIRLGSFVTNVMNRHPAVLARMVATVAEISAGRLEVGLGIGGHPAEHQSYGIDFPTPSDRGERLEETVAVLRLLLAGGPADHDGRWYRLRSAHAFPVPPVPPRIVIAGRTPEGARRAARIGDAWTCFASEHERLHGPFREALARAGRAEGEVPVIVALDWPADGVDLDALAETWAERRVSELVLHAIRPPQLDAVLDAASRAGTLRRASPGEGLRSGR